MHQYSTHLPALSAQLTVATSSSKSNADLWQRHIENLSNPHTFAFTIDLSQGRRPSIDWRCNTDLHFGFENLNKQDFIQLIHQSWVDIYLAYEQSVLRLVQACTCSLEKANASYSIMVPLRHIEGRYYWYNQVCIPGAFDRQGRMISYLNHFHKATPYGSLRPGHPIITCADRRRPKEEALIRRRSQGVLNRLLFGQLTKREKGVLFCFRAIYARTKKEVTNQQVSHAMKLAVGTINKNNTRILTKVKDVFPANSFHTLSEFAAFLNTLFGPPMTKS